MPWAHHTMLHFVLGLAFLPPLLGAIVWRREDGAWSRELRLIVYFLALAAMGTIASGLLSAAHVISRGMDPAKVEVHRNIALGAGAMLLGLALATWRVAASGSGRYRALTVASGLGAVLVSAAGHFGGEMLHPGLLPGSGMTHSHGPSSPTGIHSEGSASMHGGMPMPGEGSASAHGDMHAPSVTPAASPVVTASALSPSISASAVPQKNAVPTVAPKKTPSPAAPTPSPGGHAGMPGM